MRLRLRTFLFAGLLVLRCPSGQAALAQQHVTSAPPICMAPEGYRDDASDTRFYAGRATEAVATHALGRVEVSRRLAGRYRLYLVYTEGTDRKAVAQYTLTLAPVDSALQRLCAGDETFCDQPIRLRPVRGVRRLDRVTWGKVGAAERSADSVWVFYRPQPGLISLQFVRPGLVDAGGPVLALYDVSPSGFSGRWEDGGLGVLQLPTSMGAVVERQRGYFCAARLADGT